MTEDLIIWLRAQLEEDEQVARGADPDVRWRLARGEFGPMVVVGDDEEAHWQREVNYQIWHCDDELDGCPEIARGWDAEGEHIARHDPARVLREVEAKRRILEAYEQATRDGYDAGYVRFGDWESCSDGCALIALEHVVRILAEGSGMEETR